MHTVNLAQRRLPLLEDLRSYPYEDPETLEGARDYCEEVKSDQHRDDDHPAQSRRMDPVRVLPGLAEEIIGFAEGSPGRRPDADGREAGTKFSQGSRESPSLTDSLPKAWG